MLVVTFYSFKGGVGRTTLATNIAVRLAEREQRVLLVDFDLEAPGLTYLDELRPPDDAERPRGVAGFLVDSWHARSSADYREYLYDLNGFSGRLAVMPAGATESDRFGHDLDVLHREEILNLSEPGAKAAAALTLLADLRQQWISDFDYVLIDSRTGFSDIGGICTRVLPDLVVAVLSLNSQGVEGTSQVLGLIGSESILGQPIKKLTAVSMVPYELQEQSTRVLDAMAKDLQVRRVDLLILPFFLPLLVQIEPFLGRRVSRNGERNLDDVSLNPLVLAYDGVLERIRSENQADAEHRFEKARGRITTERDREPMRRLLEDLFQTPTVLPIPRASRVPREGAALMLSAADRRRRLAADADLAIRSLRLAAELFTRAARDAFPYDHVQTVRSLADALTTTARDAVDPEPNLVEAMDLYRLVRDEVAEADILDQLGAWAERRRRLDEADRLYRQALTIKERLGDERGRARTLLHVGAVVRARGRLEEAEQFYRQSLAVRERLGDEAGQTTVLAQLGRVAHERGHSAEAERWYRKSLAIKERRGHERGLASTFYQLGIVVQAQGRIDEAEHWYRESLSIRERLRDERGQANALRRLGILAQERELYGEAERWYRKSLAILVRLGIESSQANLLHRLGRLEEDQGNLAGALEHFGSAAAIHKSVNDHQGAASAAESIARVQEKLKDAK